LSPKAHIAFDSSAEARNSTAQDPVDEIAVIAGVIAGVGVTAVSIPRSRRAEREEEEEEDEEEEVTSEYIDAIAVVAAAAVAVVASRRGQEEEEEEGK
jgi:hypothetical protein